jgi:predicted O-linked N-acetylglucosamine transferase (SPINDLY family)
MDQKGVIICGGDTYFVSIIICIENIYKYNSTIKIEWYYCGDELFDFQKKYVIEKYKNVNLINCLDVIPNWFPETITQKQIKGFMMKPFSLMTTKFSEVLLLDADNLPVFNIESLFNNPTYLLHDNIFWPDIDYENKTKMLPLGNDVYKKFKVDVPLYLTDSGQVLININKCWESICVCYYINYNFEIFYKLFYGDKDIYYIAFKLTNKFYNLNKYKIIPCTNEGNEYTIINTIIQRNPLDGSHAFIHRMFSKISNNNYTKIIYMYDENNIIKNNQQQICVDLPTHKFKDNHGKIEAKIKKIDIFNIIQLTKMKDLYNSNITELINKYNSIIQTNVVYFNNKFQVINHNELYNSLFLLGMYSKYNTFHLNCHCIYYIITQNFNEAFNIIHKVFEQKINNNDSLLILIFMFRLQMNLNNFNNIIKLLNNEQLFIFIFQLYNSFAITIETIEKLLLNKGQFYKDFIKVFNFDSLPLLEDNLNKLLENSDKIPKFSIPIYFNKFYRLSFKNNNNLKFRQKVSKLNRLLFPLINYVGSNVEENRKTFNQKQIKRVGFISTNFRLHSVGRDRIGVIRNMNRDLFDIVIFHFEEYNNDMYFNLLKTSGLKNVILKGDFNVWIKMIEHENLDILVYADIGMQEETYLLAHTRLAPVQITTFGHSESSGIDTIDYYLSSELYESSNCNEHYSEKLILQKSLGTFYYDRYYDFILNSKDPNYTLKLDTGKIYLTNLQYLHKSSESDFILYEKIFDNILNVYIVFVNGTGEKIYEDSLRKRLSKYMDRIVILPKLATCNYYKLIQSSYLILDTYPHGGCNSTLESFNYNKIVITYPSEFLRGRFTQGFYKKMGMSDECIVNSLDEYIGKIKFFLDNPKEKESVEQLITNNKYKLYNDLESIYEWNNILHNIKII